MTTHCRLASVMPRSRCADGSAMFTMEASRMIMSWAMAMTQSARQRLGSGPSGASSDATSEIDSADEVDINELQVRW